MSIGSEFQTLSRSMMFGSVESERPTLTNREIIFEVDVITIHQRHRQKDRQAGGRADGRTDDMRSQDRALHCSASRGKNSQKYTAFQNSDSITLSGGERKILLDHFILKSG